MYYTTWLDMFNMLKKKQNNHLNAVFTKCI